MKFEFEDDIFQDEIYFMQLKHQMESQQIKANATMGFNNDAIYQKIENK